VVIRVVSYPDSDRNPYFALFFNALKPYGVDVSYVSMVRDRMLDHVPRQFDVLHFHWGLEYIWRWRARGPAREILNLVGWLRFLRLARRAGVRLVWTAHELAPPERGRWFDWVGYAACARSADLCISHSEHCRQELCRRFRIDPAKVITIPMGTSYGVFPTPEGRAATLQRYDLPAACRLLLTFGDMRPRKGIEVAIDAARLLGDPYQLIVVGGIPEATHRTWLEKVRRRGSETPNVTLHLDRVSEARLASLIHAADCVLLPYLNILASSALSASLALGRAVVASDLPFFREVLALEPAAGVLAPPGDAPALARAVTTFFTGPMEVRHAAAGRLGQRLAWSNVIAPVGEWLVSNVPARSIPG
jgi:beta-1,4-mannosyltransferase